MRRGISGLEHSSGAIPVYKFIVDQRPYQNSPKGRVAYVTAVKEAARREIPAPLEGDDLEIEILYASREGIVIDLDNMVRPLLNALEGLAYLNDRQVRSLQATRFDLTTSMGLSGNVEVIQTLFSRGADHRVMVLIYSERERIRRLSAAAGLGVKPQ